MKLEGPTQMVVEMVCSFQSSPPEENSEQDYEGVAQEILEAEGGAHGRFPGGNYYNSSKITPSFFDDKPKSDRVAKLVNQATPEDLLASDDILNADNTIDSNKKTPQAEEREGEIYDRAD
ncbi:hypothetical protein MJO28_008480 [Puccinia striiformis f. sp. tritici]|uniref:Uncharacterized protein n=1 Tax=Puccinia striiformis f. sp. tritici TaxID=168172 RepID=A0ACC0EB17_9BASI|nr:hypothetical protein MJO28_008480 [Puccinia striiformis f. sp. tritici]